MPASQLHLRAAERSREEPGPGCLTLCAVAGPLPACFSVSLSACKLPHLGEVIKGFSCSSPPSLIMGSKEHCHGPAQASRRHSPLFLDPGPVGIGGGCPRAPLGWCVGESVCVCIPPAGFGGRTHGRFIAGGAAASGQCFSGDPFFSFLLTPLELGCSLTSHGSPQRSRVLGGEVRQSQTTCHGTPEVKFGLGGPMGRARARAATPTPRVELSAEPGITSSNVGFGPPNK